MSVMKAAPGEQSCSPGKTRKWLSLVLGTLLLASFAFGALPALEQLPGVKQHHELIIEEEIEAGAFFYTDVAKVRDAEIFMLNTLGSAR